jgi:hypothetical protein
MISSVPAPVREARAARQLPRPSDLAELPYGMIRRGHSAAGFLQPVNQARTGVSLGSVIKKRRKKMRKHKHKKMLKKTRWQRRAHA